LINPIAGIGGSVGLKGSDGAAIQEMALSLGAVKKAELRAKAALQSLLSLCASGTSDAPRVQGEIPVIYTASGTMGEHLAREMGFPVEVVYQSGDITSGADTEAAARILSEIPVDVLLFAGGDGTACNVHAGMNGEARRARTEQNDADRSNMDIGIGVNSVSDIPVIGIPAGVKIHSAVYATSPAAAGRALYACLTGHFRTRQAEVMDIDEAEYRRGHLGAELYGYMTVPAIQDAIQNPKAASHNGAEDLEGLCFEIERRIADESGSEREMPEKCYVFGAGSTVNAVMKHLGYEGSLLGIDVMQGGKVIAKDVTENMLLSILEQYPCQLILTVIGGQGCLFGRGNQQLSPEVIRRIGLDHLWIVAVAGKIYSLPDQSLFVDTGDESLDDALRGYRKVIVGWQETLVCRIR
jgi:predicted polyphosphate/ATP-dependent NAD kinase